MKVWPILIMDLMSLFPLIDFTPQPKKMKIIQDDEMQLILVFNVKTVKEF